MCHLSYLATAQRPVALPAAAPAVMPVAPMLPKSADLMPTHPKGHGACKLTTTVVSTTSMTTTIMSVATPVTWTSSSHSLPLVLIRPPPPSSITLEEAWHLQSSYSYAFGYPQPPPLGTVPEMVPPPVIQTPMASQASMGMGSMVNAPPGFYSMQTMQTWDFQHGLAVHPQCPVTPVAKGGGDTLPSSSSQPATKRHRALVSTGEESRPKSRDRQSEELTYIALDSNGDGDSGEDCLVIDDEPVDHKVLEKKSQVSKPPSESCSSLKAMQSAAAVVGSAHINDVLGPVSLSEGETTDHDTMPVTTPRKKTVKKKKTKKKEDRGKPGESSESDNPRAKHMGDQLEEDRIKREGQIRTLGSEYPIIKQIRAEMKLPNQTVTQWDMMPFLDRINKYRQEELSEPEWSKSFIWSVAMMRKNFRVGLNSSKLSDEMKDQYTNALELIDKYTTETLMPQSRHLRGQPKLHITHLGWVFVDHKGKQQRVLEGDPGCAVTFGLLKLHAKEVICRHQQDSVTISGQCPICVYYADNHDSVNNHIRLHYRMGLICTFCYHIKVSMGGMVTHGEDDHTIDLKGDKDKHQGTKKTPGKAKNPMK